MADFKNVEVQRLRHDLLNLNPNDESARVELNKKLIERYPFLECKSWDSSVPRDYTYTFLDHMPKGWKRSFGIYLCEELREELIRIDPSLLDTYRVSQVKEKYGTLRWYDAHYSDRMEDILTKYEDISKYTCIICGKINVPVFDDGWISPFCIDCFKKNINREMQITDEEAESFIIEEPNLPRDTIITIQSSTGTERRRIDFSETLTALGVDPNSLPTIEEILQKRKEEENVED